MHRTPSRRRSAARLLSLAAAAGLGAFYNTAPDPANPPAGGGAGGNNNAVPNKPDDKGETIPRSELDALIAAAVKAEQDKAAAAARKKQEDDEEKKAEEEGRFKDLLAKSKDENAALKAENRTLKTRIALGDHLAAKHPDYVGRAKYILPLIPADTPEDGLAKAVEAAAAEFVKDNPAQPRGAAAAPPAPRGGNVNRPNGAANGHQQKPARQPSVAGSRF